MYVPGVTPTRPHLDIVKVERAGAGGPQSELVLLLANLKPFGVSVHNETGDAFVSLETTKTRELISTFLSEGCE